MIHGLAIPFSKFVFLNEVTKAEVLKEINFANNKTAAPFSTIPNFDVSTAIINTTGISCRWCKLNFGPLRGHVNSRHFPERINARRQYFYLFV